MSKGSTVLGLAGVIALVGCVANEETPTGAITATNEIQVLSREGDDAPATPSTAASLAFDNDDDDAVAARMPNNKHPDLTK